MEFMPRITRAQVMDVLSSQANLAGYRAVIEAAAEYGRALPMMMTAAGTVPAAKVFIMGVGVAGLQAIATARRLGAIVTATDVRPATKEQVESLGAKFVAVEDEEFKQAETGGGYAKEMSHDYQAKQAALVREPHRQAGHRHHHRADPRPAGAAAGLRRHGALDAARLRDRRPRRRARRQLRADRPGEVVDTDNGVKIVGYLNLAGTPRRDGLEPLRPQPLRLRRDADRQGREGLRDPWDDELVKATLLTRDGDLVHPNFGRPPDAACDPSPLRKASSHGARRSHRHQQLLERAQAAAEAARHAADAAQAYADQIAHAGGGAAHAASGGAIDPFVFRLAIFALAVFVGYYVVWSVTPALHTPLMSVTNAISSVIVVGALLLVGVDASALGQRGADLGAHLRLHRPDPRLREHLRRLPRHRAHARHVQEEGLSR